MYEMTDWAFFWVGLGLAAAGFFIGTGISYHGECIREAAEIEANAGLE
jgi:hypothetical protein